MNPDTVISVENLGKSYLISHQRGGPSYRRLSEEIVEAVARPLRALRRGAEPAPALPSSKERFWALRGVGFEVKRGEVLGIIGRNGAGKSTLLKILSRITEPTEGRVRIRGRVASLLEVGTGFHPELTGRENVYLNGTILGMSRREIERKFDEIVAFAEIEKFLDTPVKRYSSGMYVRLAFAVAAHLEPEILIVDEVLAVGDIQFQKKCLGKMQDVSRAEGRTVLFVSHNMGAICNLCPSTLLLERGNIRFLGKTPQAVTAYLDTRKEAARVDLDALRLPGMPCDARFLDARLADTNDKGCVNFGEPIAFDLRISARRTLHNLSIGSSIFRMDSTCVGTLFTADTFDLATGETKTLRLAINDAKLAPGTYYIGFSVGQGGHRGSRQDFDVVIGVPVFEVSPISGDHSWAANWHPAWGSVMFENVMLKELEIQTT
ncbi:MAG TPA: ABC transporter ATP-binding protein [Verrucomicrobiae bacterium]|nr:ABC transporter ATP-binding protein [Verrucomicrobiae bacterium]